VELIPGKLYKLKNPTWFYDKNHDMDQHFCWPPGTLVMFLGFSYSTKYEKSSLYNVYFLVSNKIIYYESNKSFGESFELFNKNLEDICYDKEL
jgi:hypothetical protein